jgi:hypothetical protein
MQFSNPLAKPGDWIQAVGGAGCVALSILALRPTVPRKNDLIFEWVRLGRIGPPGAPESQQKIDKLASRIADHRRLSINEFTDRGSMLTDLRSRVSLMSRDLRDLLKATSIPPSVGKAQ